VENPSTWEILLAGALAVLLILWFRPGIKAALERSKQAEKDWKSVLLPLAVVTAFVILLIMLV
jgi:hypothetical protein